MKDKIMSIGTVCQLTGLSERQIRYYEQRRLIFPERTHGGTRKYSIQDVEELRDILRKRQDGLNTMEIREEKMAIQKKRLRGFAQQGKEAT